MLLSHSRRIITGLFALVLTISASTSCGGMPAIGSLSQPQIAMLKSDLARETSPVVAQSKLGELTNGNNAFAFDLYRTAIRKEGNLFFSPYSISIALSMTYAGARNETAQQMARTLHYTLPPDQLHPAFNALDLQLAVQDPSSFKLNVVNSIWGQSGFPLRQEFLDTLARNYGAGLNVVDFNSDARREEARQSINNWVSNQTEGKIKDLIGKDAFNEYTRLVLANAIYFKGEWQNPFNPATPGEFTTLRGEQVSVPIISRRADYRYAEETGYQAVQLPYKGDRISMIILLPAQGEFESIERSLDKDQFQGIMGKLHEQDIKVYMPKFSFESRLGLSQTLSDMGMPDAFDRSRSDFTGMYDENKVSQRLFVSDVVHGAWVAVDERGTEAAAATGVIMEIVSMPKEVRIDRPFIFIIHDRQTNSILFIGRVLDPTR